MKNKLFITILFFLCFASLNAQDKVKTYSLKKGEVLDVMLLTSNPNSKKAFNNYKKTAFPVAFEYTYTPQPGFKIEKRIFGSSSPELFLFGSWNSLSKRKSFLENIVKRVPDFHEQRIKIFNHFKLTFFEMQKDITFSINKEKTTVVTSLWKNNNMDSSNFISTWKQQVASHNGKIILKLTNGESPLGYTYNPDILIITEWDTKEALDKFVTAHPLGYYKALKNIEQFVIK